MYTNVVDLLADWVPALELEAEMPVELASEAAGAELEIVLDGVVLCDPDVVGLCEFPTAGFDPVIDEVFEAAAATVPVVVPVIDLEFDGEIDLDPVPVAEAAAAFVPESEVDTEAAVTAEAETDGEIP